MRGERISVIVPAYNIEAYIEKTIQSICCQTYRNLEIIIVDDGSTDTTGEIVESLKQKDLRIKVIHQKNGGVTSARLAGLKTASGDWISFVDGDDYLEPEMYQVLLSNAQKYQADISHCGYQMVFPNRADYYHNTGKIVTQTRESGVRDLLKGDFVEPGLWNKIYRADIIRNSNIMRRMDLSVRINEDYLMNYYLFSQARRSVFEDRCLYHYIVRKDSAATSSMNINKLRDPVKVCAIIIRETKEHKEWQEIVKNRFVNLLINIAALDKKDLAWAEPFQKKAKIKLRKLLPKVVSGNYSKRTKILATLASVSPLLYGKVHTLYAHIKGTDRKYLVE